MEKLNEWGNIYGLGGQSILEICSVSQYWWIWKSKEAKNIHFNKMWLFSQNNHGSWHMHWVKFVVSTSTICDFYCNIYPIKMAHITFAVYVPIPNVKLSFQCNICDNKHHIILYIIMDGTTKFMSHICHKQRPFVREKPYWTLVQWYNKSPHFREFFNFVSKFLQNKRHLLPPTQLLTSWLQMAIHGHLVAEGI